MRGIVDSTDKEFYEYEYDIPEWFQKAWAWLLNRYPRVKPMPSDQTYWSAFHKLDVKTLKKAIHKAAMDSPDWFPEVRQILGVYALFREHQDSASLYRQPRRAVGISPRVRELLDDFYEKSSIRGMEIEDAAEERELSGAMIQRCEQCTVAQVNDGFWLTCKHSTNNRGTTRPSWGKNCNYFDLKKDQIPF